MSTSKSKWKHPETIIAVIGLIISLIFNILQLNTNIDINHKADIESKRADAIQQQRDIWITNLKSQLSEVDKEILKLQNQSRIDNQGLSFINDREREHASEAIQENMKVLISLQNRKTDLEQQINNFLSIK